MPEYGFLRKDEQKKSIRTQFQLTYPEVGVVEIKTTQELTYKKLMAFTGRKTTQELPRLYEINWTTVLTWFDKTLDK